MSTITSSVSFEELTRRHRAIVGILELILRSCELSAEQHDAIKRHYTEKVNRLKECEWLRQFDLHLTPQGSVALGTCVPPLERKHGEHDVDLLLKVIAPQSAFTSAELHRRIGSQLRLYYRELMQAIRYGWQLDYSASERFHFDIVGVIPWVHAARPMVAACDWQNASWKPTNPEDYIREFLKTAEQLPLIEDKNYRELLEGELVLMNARSVTVDPLPENTAMKSPLQRSVQLPKRHRDVWFSKRKALNRRTPSIVLTTILWQAYERFIIGKAFASVFDVLSTMAEHLDDLTILKVTTDHRGEARYVLENPTVPGENLVAKWNEPDRKHEAAEYFEWVREYKKFVRALASTDGLHRLQPALAEALGKETVEPAFKTLVSAMRPDPDRVRINMHPTFGLTSVTAASAVAVRPHTYHGTI